jgi:predicted nucleic acid-binding Zn finger protein
LRERNNSIVRMISDAQWALLEAAFDVPQQQQQIDAGTATSHVLHCMNFIFHDNRRLLEAAVDIIDDFESPVRKYHCEASGRCLHKVQGAQGREYICLGDYCSCANFLQTSRHLQKNVICKHLLCIRLATALGKVTVQDITVEKFVAMLCEEPHR